MLPVKTYYSFDRKLNESDFDVNGDIRLHRLMEILQDAATAHADLLGFGWDELDSQACLWVLSKIKMVFHKPITRKCGEITLYSWPLKPTRFFAERCFEIYADGEHYLSATSLWLIIDRQTRRIATSDRLESVYRADFDTAHSDCTAEFERVRRDDGYVFDYCRTIRRTDLDINGHANNTYYVNFALDALQREMRVTQAEITYLKELTAGDEVKIYSKTQGNCVYVVGERDEPSFTVKFTLAQ